MGDQESLLEIGLLLLGAGILTGIAALIYGRMKGNGRHSERKAGTVRRNPAAAGTMSSDRHRNIQTVAAR